jgi:hypothetical protein
VNNAPADVSDVRPGIRCRWDARQHGRFREARPTTRAHGCKRAGDIEKPSP